MGANLTKIFVVDLEATCWRTPEEQGDLPNEIIEIGVCELKLSRSGRRIENKHSIVVRPEVTTISEFCTELTGWTQGQIDAQGVPIADALLEFQRLYNPSKHHVWGSFGEYDRHKLSSDPHDTGGLFSLYGIDVDQNPFARMRSHLNIKTLMALKENLPKELGLARALTFYGLEMEGRHHNGADDAWNIARILDRVLS